MGAEDPQGLLDLVDWRRRVGDVYRGSRRGGLEAFRSERDRLFGEHPQSPIPAADLATFAGLEYFPPSPTLRFECELRDPLAHEEVEIDSGGPDGVIRYVRAGRLHFEVDGEECALTLFSIQGYGGGLFLPFRDATSGQTTYGGGRYLCDTIKNTDAGCLEVTPGSRRVVIDFNYAYNPSCAYNHRWACPLAPLENWLTVPIEGGEKSYPTPG
ncbi:MAG: DUF1684 domain-containing protein [Candidatus Dormibacteria bacterium]